MGNDTSSENVRNILKRGASQNFSFPENEIKLLSNIEKEEKKNLINVKDDNKSVNSTNSSFLDSLNSEIKSNKNKLSLTDPKTAINEKFVNSIPYNLIGYLIVKYEKDNLEYYYNCFIINTNCFMTLKNNIYNNKLGNAREIKVNFTQLKIKKENIIIKGKYVIIGFENDFSKNYFGLESLNEEEKEMKEFFVSSVLNVNSYNIQEIHSIISYSNSHIIIQDSDKEKINKIIGSPLYYFDIENKVYVIGLIDENFNYTFFNNNDIEEFSNSIKTFKILQINENKQNLENKSIERLDLSGITLTNENIKFLLKDDFINLKYLDISNIQNEDCSYIFELVYKNLQYLNLNYNNIKDSGLSQLEKCDFPFLKNLQLKNNLITKDGLDIFIKNCQFIKNLTVLNLSNNKLSDDNIYNICLNLKELIKLDLKNTEITDISIEYIVNLLPNIQIIDITDNYLTRNFCENLLKKSNLKQYTVSYPNLHKKKNIKKNLDLVDNAINNQLIKNMNFFDKIEINPCKFPNLDNFNDEDYLILFDDKKNNINEEIEHNLQNKLDNTKNIPNNIFNVKSKLSLKNKYLYNCILELKVSFPKEKNKIFYSNCFILGTNLLVTLTDNLFNAEKEEGIFIDEKLNKEKKIIYENDDISYIIFQNPIFEEWLGCKPFSEQYKDTDKFLISFFEDNLNIAKVNDNVLEIKNEKEKGNLNLIPGSPIIIFENNDNNQAYVIGLCNKKLEIRFINKEDLEQFSYNQKLIKLMRNKFNCYDLEEYLINLSLTDIQLNDNDIKQFLLLKLKNLEQLNFSKNNIGAIGCFYLSKMNFPKLIKLILSNNNIKDGGFKNICYINSPKLQFLDINHNNITQNSIVYLKKINFMKELNSLDLGNNLIKDEGIKILCQIELYNLTYLNIENIGMNDLGLSEFTKDNTFFDKLNELNIKNNNYDKNSNSFSILNSKIANFQY